MATKRKQTKAPVKKKTRQPGKQSKMAVTDKHKLFAMHYALTSNAKDSAMKAGFTKATADRKAHTWVGQSLSESFYPELYEMVEEIRATQIKPKLEKQFAITADRVLNELARIGFSDVRKFYNDDNSLKAPKDMDDDCAAVVSSIEVDEIWEYNPEKECREQVGETKKLKMWDKKGALEMLGKHLGLWKDSEGPQMPTAVTLIVNAQGQMPKVSDGN